MSFSYDVSTDAGRVRLLVPDNQFSDYMFEDDEIAAFLALEGSDVRRAAAMALETIASNEAMVLKVIQILDLRTDGAKTSDALLKRAKTLRDQADAEEAVEDGGAFDIAEWVVDPFTGRERIAKEILRES